MGPLALYMSSFSHTTPRKAKRVGTKLGCTVDLRTVIATRTGKFSRGVCLSSTAEAGIRRANKTGFLFMAGSGAMMAPRSSAVLPSVAEHSLVCITRRCLKLGMRRESMCFSRIGSFTRYNLYKATTIVSPINGVIGRNRRVYFPDKVRRVKPAVTGLHSALANVRVKHVRTPRK